MKDCAQVIGVEIQQEAVNMAKLNAIENGIENAQFFAGKAEEIMIKREFQNPENADDVVAIVDPPRAGLRKNHGHNFDFKFEGARISCRKQIHENYIFM